jgi:tetratricopeptide (TPR) repeat protein
MHNLAALDPANATNQKEFAKLLAWSADAERALGHLDKATALRSQEIALLNQALTGPTADVELRQNLIIARQALGLLLISRGQVDRGIAELRSAVAEADRLIPIEPTNTLWKGIAAAAGLDLAKALLATGDRQAAAQETSDACGLIARIGGDSARRQTACLAMKARLALKDGSDAAALGFAQQALAAAQRVRGEDPSKDRFTVGAMYRLVGDARVAAGDREAARIAWSSALSALPQDVPELPSETDEHSIILERLGQTGEAARLVSSLNAIGYKRLT